MNHTLMTVTYNITATTTGSESTQKPTTTSEVSTTVFIYSGALTAQPITVQFKEGGLSTAAPAVSTRRSSSTTSSNSAPMAILTTADANANGLSDGAKAGIGVGVSLGVFALVAIALGLWWMRKRRATPEQGRPEWAKAELSNEPMEAKELPANADPVEMQ